jgi:Skp family chaperone for outer membrane proteins
MTYIFPVLMIVLGSFLEIWYYQFRFSGDGIQPWLSVIIGVALTLLLSLAVYKRRERWAWFIIIPVALYSIMATSAGQAFSLNEILSQDTRVVVQQEYIDDEIEDIRDRIAWIDDELKRLRSQIDATVETLEDRAMWRTTLAAAEDREIRLTEERKELQAKLSGYRQESTRHEDVVERSRNIYQFYADLFGWSEEWLQFFLQTVLSTFVAAMSPIGIMTLPKKKKRRTYSKQGVTNEQVERWVRINWIGIRTGKSNKILPHDTYRTFLQERGKPYSKTVYEDIFSRAVKSGIIQRTGEIAERDEKKAVSIMKGVDTVK